MYRDQFRLATPADDAGDAIAELHFASGPAPRPLTSLALVESLDIWFYVGIVAAVALTAAAALLRRRYRTASDT